MFEVRRHRPAVLWDAFGQTKTFTIPWIDMNIFHYHS